MTTEEGDAMSKRPRTAVEGVEAIARALGAKTMTDEQREVLDSRFADAESSAHDADRDVRVASEKLRRDLDDLDGAIAQGYRAPAGVLPDRPFIASTADDVVRAVVRREAAHRKMVEIEQLSKALGHNPTTKETA